MRTGLKNGAAPDHLLVASRCLDLPIGHDDHLILRSRSFLARMPPAPWKAWGCFAQDFGRPYSQDARICLKHLPLFADSQESALRLLCQETQELKNSSLGSIEQNTCGFMTQFEFPVLTEFLLSYCYWYLPTRYELLTKADLSQRGAPALKKHARNAAQPIHRHDAGLPRQLAWSILGFWASFGSDPARASNWGNSDEEWLRSLLSASASGCTARHLPLPLSSLKPLQMLKPPNCRPATISSWHLHATRESNAL